jgi:diguanylate cyclase (GGDEF)-like protein
MRLLTDLARSPIARRLVPIVTLCLALPVLALVAAIAGSLHERDDAAAQAAIERSAATVAAAVAARIDAADAVAAALVARGGREPLEGLRRAALDSGMFVGVLAGDADGAGSPATGPSVLQPSANPLRGAVLLSSPLRADAGRAWLVRRGRLGAREVLLYFELAPQWLWSPGAAAGADGAMVIDAHSATLLRGAVFPLHASGVVVAHVAARPGAPAAVERVAWQAEGGEWRGALVPVPLARAIQVDAPWRVVSAARAPSRSQALEPLRRAALAATALSLLLAAGVATFASLRYRLGLMELRRGVLRMGTSRFTPVGEEARLPGLIEVANAVDDVGARVHEDVVAFETLGEIDQLLLGATELEPVLDAILKRVTTVTRCQSVGIALLDSDSPALGRVYVASRDGQPLPVARVEFDLEVVEHLASVGDGVTIARCEEGRHSFLRPMRDLGSEFFWVWPVITGERLVAVLAAGFGEEPAPDPRFARHGSEFASRLAVALSKTARDEHLYRQAHFDPLTSLPNRLLFRDRLAQELANAQESRSLGALLYIDLDHFKKVNDSVGHAAGDQLLQIVSQRLRACVKEGDTVARLAGDEFTVILRNVADPESAALVAERVIDSLKIPINVAGRDHHVPASIGITLFPNDGTSIEELMRNADGAMYRAKNQGRNRAVFFDRRLMANRFDPTHSGLHRALRRREFSLFYQPQFRMADGALAGVEALLRWQTPRDGTRSPADIIPAAEASGLIVDIGSWVLESACAQLALWREQGIAPPRVSVNVSVQQLKFAEFTRNVRRILDKHGIPPELVEIEMTESVFADEAAGAVLRQLAELGVRLALDDFGTGYSSLNYLRQHPIKVVKIDRSFLEDLPMNPASATLAETIITMAHALGKEVVAEGVETEEQMQFLRERRCDHAQGFYLAHPMPVPQITEMLASRRGADSIERLRDVG